MSKFITETSGSGINRKCSYKEGDIIVCSEQDVEPYLKQCAHARNHEAHLVNKKAPMRKAFDLPPIIVEKLMKEYGINVFNVEDEKRLLKVLYRDFPAFRTDNGKYI